MSCLETWVTVMAGHSVLSKADIILHDNKAGSNSSRAERLAIYNQVFKKFPNKVARIFQADMNAGFGGKTGQAGSVFPPQPFPRPTFCLPPHAASTLSYDAPPQNIHATANISSFSGRCAQSVDDALHNGWFDNYDWVIRINPDVMIMDGNVAASCVR